MSYKFQLGPARMSGSLVQEGSANIAGGLQISGSVALDGSRNASLGTATCSGILKTDDTTDATSKTDGSLQTDGGLSVAKAIYNGTAATLAADSGVVTIGSSTAAVFSAAGKLAINSTVEATSTTDGSLQTDGGLSVAKSAVIGDDLDLLSNSAIFKVGSDQPFTLTHANANNTLLASADHRLAFGDAGEYIAGDGTDLKIVSSNDIDVTGDMNVVGEVTSTKLTTLASAEGVTTIGSATSAVFSAAGILNINNSTDATSATDGSLQTDGGLSVVKDAILGNDLKLLSDSAVLAFGAGADVTFTHSNDVGVLLNSDNQLQFGDSATHIAQSADANLKLTSDGSVEMSVGAAGVKITGTTPKLTIGDAGAEDTAIVFDGNAQDFYIALDDSADDLLIGLGSTVGSTPALAIDENLKATFMGAVTLGDASGDDITFVGAMASGIVPKTDSSYDLGSNGNRWQTIYVDSIVGADIAMDVESRAGGQAISAGTEFALITAGHGVTVTLPAASAGKSLHVKLSSSIGDVILAAAAGDLIEDQATVRLESTGSAVNLVAYDAQSWFIV